MLCRLNAVDLARLSEALGFDEIVPDLEFATTVARFSEARIATRRNIELGDSEDLAAVHSWIHEYPPPPTNGHLAMFVARHTLRSEIADHDGVVSRSFDTRPACEGEVRIWLFNQRTLYQHIVLATPTRVLTYKAPRYSETSVLFDIDELIISDGPVTVHPGSACAPPVFTMSAV